MEERSTSICFSGRSGVHQNVINFYSQHKFTKLPDKYLNDLLSSFICFSKCTGVHISARLVKTLDKSNKQVMGQGVLYQCDYPRINVWFSCSTQFTF
jgi:hypothetical protein